MDILPHFDPTWLLPEKQYAFGYVTGVIFGDGSISRETNRIPHTCKDGTVRYHLSTIYLVRLQVTSQDFAERFASQWETLIGRPAKLWITTRTNFSTSTLKGRSEEYSLQLFNFRRCHVVLGRYLAYLKYENHSARIVDFPLEVIRGFIHGMIDSEGYVRPEYIDIANKDIELLNTLVIIFKQIGYSASIYTSPSNSVSHLRTHYKYQKYTNSL